MGGRRCRFPLEERTPETPPQGKRGHYHPTHTPTHTHEPLQAKTRRCWGGHKLFPKCILNVSGRQLPPLESAHRAPARGHNDSLALPAVSLCKLLELRSSRRGHPSHQLQQVPNPVPMPGPHGHLQPSSGLH